MDTDLEARARSLYSWDARIRLLQAYDRVRAERDRALDLLLETAAEDAAFVQDELNKARAEWAQDPTWHPAPHRVEGVWHWDHTGQTCEQYAAAQAAA